MGEDGFTLTALIKGKLDKASMEEEIKKADGLFAKMRVGGRQFRKGFAGGLLGKTAEARTTMGGIGMTAGKAAIPLAILTGIGYGVKKMVGFLAASSAHLKGTLAIMSRSYAIFWRPFGDALAVLIFPMAKAMLKFSSWFLKASKEKGGGFGAILETLVMDIPEAFGSWMWEQVTNAFGIKTLSPLKGWGAWFFGVLSVPALFQFAPMIKLGMWLYHQLAKISRWGLNILSRFGGWLGRKVADVKMWGLNVTFNLGRWLINKAKSIFKGWGGGGGGGLINKIIGGSTGGDTDGGRRGGRRGGVGDMWRDFISRPGQGIQAFSPDDTIIGFKGSIGNALGGGAPNVVVKVFLGDREITDIIRTEIEEDRWRRGAVS